MTEPRPSTPARGPQSPPPGGRVRRRDAAIAGIAFVVLGAVLAVSAWRPWFSSSIGTSPKHDINAFRKGEWLFNLPVGWIVVGVGALSIAAGIALIAPRRVRWSVPSFVLLPLVPAATFVWILADRAHVHDKVNSNLKAAVDKVVAAQPAQAGQAKALLASAHFTDRYGLWVALAATAAATLVAGELLRRSRRATTASTGEA